jgi:predicted O-methyltransferase YrrM
VATAPTVPPLVQRALALGERTGFGRSCSDATGRLLHVLAGSRGTRRVAEIGTGAGVGAAWMVSALAPEVPFFTAESDAARAAAARELFAADEHVHVLEGDWRETLPREAPFDLVFFDAAKHVSPREDAPLVAGLLAPRGLVVLDDLEPGCPADEDPVRDAWLRGGHVHAVELQVSPRESVLLGAAGG